MFGVYFICENKKTKNGQQNNINENFGGDCGFSRIKISPNKRHPNSNDFVNTKPKYIYILKVLRLPNSVSKPK